MLRKLASLSRSKKTTPPKRNITLAVPTKLCYPNRFVMLRGNKEVMLREPPIVKKEAGGGGRGNIIFKRYESYVTSPVSFLAKNVT